MDLRVAVAGSPLSTPSPGGTVEGIHRAADLGLRAMEIEWVQMVPRDPKRMVEIRAAAEARDVRLTVHAPYFVNLNAHEPAKLEASIQRILAALSMAQLCGAWSVCVHPAFYLKDDPALVLDRVRQATEVILREKASRFPDVNLAYESMGKPTQFGSLEEVLAVSREFGLVPCIDAAHLHARFNGAFNSTPEWEAMLDQVQEALGVESLQRLHLHYSGIAYSEKGERHHLPFPESDARWQDYLAVLKRRGVGGQLVCESPLMEAEALLLAETLANIDN
jgi:deoxyribonuclease-4